MRKNIKYKEFNLEENKDLLLENLKENFNIDNIGLKKLNNDKYLVIDEKYNISLAYEMKEQFKGDSDLTYEEVYFGMWNNLKKLNNLKILNSKFRNFNNVGFFNKGFAEFIIFSKTEFTNGPYKLWSNEKHSISFKIGEVEVEFSKSSSLFSLFFLMNLEFNNEEFYETINEFDYYTVKLINVPYLKLEDYIQQSLFIINNTNIEEHPNLEYFYIPEEIISPEEISFDEVAIKPLKNENKILPKSDNVEVFAFFNKARALSENESFLWDYKALEYYFPFIRKENPNLKPTEINLLKYLLLKLENQIEYLLEYAYQKKLISVKNMNIFTEELYQYRNKIVHSKKDENFALLTPNILSEPFTIDWHYIVKELSFLTISEFEKIK